jgi:alkaline phosphatase D
MKQRAPGMGASAIVWCVALAAACTTNTPRETGPYQATGIKVGEVTADSAIVWTRLTRGPEPVPADRPRVRFQYAGEDAGPRVAEQRDRKAVVTGVVYPMGTADELPGAVPGAGGEIRTRYRPEGGAWEQTAWEPVDPERDFTRQVRLSALHPDTRYELEVQARLPSREVSSTVSGGFRTAASPDHDARVVFTVVTGQDSFRTRDRADGFEIHRSMLDLEPSFFVHTGDIVYYDRRAKNVELARYHWQHAYSQPTAVEFHRQVASYFMKDDHDLWQDDCWPGMEADNMFDFTLEQGLALFPEQVPMDQRTYRTVRWGRDLQVWLVEGRDFRSPNPAADGPEKTIWGPEQMAWFKETVAASDATFRVLISPTPIVGPDRSSKRDNHSNPNFAHEGEELRAFMAARKNMVVVCGDRHWQYASVAEDTGLREYSSGPHTDAHSGGFSNDQRTPIHRFLRVRGGFLSGTVDREKGAATLTIRFHDVNGAVQFEDRIEAGANGG